MSDTVRYTVTDRIAVVTVDHPPVNVLAQPVRIGLQRAFEQLARDDAAISAVLICAGRTFIAGADIREFERPPTQPRTGVLAQQIEASAKPVVAALHGTALGGGFEIALSCHYRMAVRTASVGLPETRLGLIPGAGGSQRLPRLIGAGAALEMIVGGARLDAENALTCGVIDRIVTGDLLQEACRASRQLAATGAWRRLSAVRLDASSLPDSRRSAWRRRIERQYPGQEAAMAALHAVAAAVDLPFEAGLAIEQQLLGELRGSSQSAALRYLFFAERQAARNAVNDELRARIAARLLQSAESAVAGLAASGVSRGRIATALSASGMRGSLALCASSSGNEESSREHPQAAQDAAIFEHWMSCMINAAAFVLEENSTLGASDIDVLCCTRLGFPRHRGGPVFQADELGLARVIAHLYERGRQPSNLLVQLAAGGLRLRDVVPHGLISWRRPSA